MKLFTVFGDDSYWDSGSRWLVGVFSTRELADAAVVADELKYNDEVMRKYLGYEVDEIALDIAL